MSRHHSRLSEETAERKLSVFERLGSKFDGNHHERICLEYATDGVCNLGKACKLAHTHNLLIASKHLALHIMKKRSTGSKKTVKSGYKLSDSAETPVPPIWDKWDFGDLEGADEKDLQKRRLQLQRELKLQMKREKGVSKKRKKKVDKKVARSPSSSSSTTSESSSSGSSSSASSIHSKKRIDRKRKGSPSSASDDSSHRKKRKIPKSPSKIKVVKKKIDSPRKPASSKKVTVVRKSVSPTWDRRNTPTKRKSPVRTKPRAPSPKHKAREASPRRTVKPKDHKVTPTRPARARSAERRRHHSPRRRREPERGGLEKGGKILPVKSSAYVKEMKESVRRKSAERLREEKEKEREKEKEKRRREQKAREVERREREREAERVRREADRQKEREDALERCRERQKERQRVDRVERDKRVKDFDRKEVEPRKSDIKSDLPSLLDIKTEAPRDQTGRVWDDRRSRRNEENFDFRRMPREEHEQPENRRGRKPHDYIHEPVGWESNEEFREPPSTTEWPRDWKPSRYEQKWNGDTSRDGMWREQYPQRRNDWHPDTAPSEDQPPVDDRSQDVIRRPIEPTPTDGPGPVPVEAPIAEVAADLEEVLSDISDDADDILNQVDEQSLEVPDTQPTAQQPVCLTMPGAEFFFDHRRPLLECLGERGLDFEEISDEELEEETRMSKGIMDVLGADWASLMKQTPVKPVKTDGIGSALRRWRVDSIIARIGLSRNLVGDEFANRYLAKIKSQCSVEDSTAIEIKNGVCDQENMLKRENGTTIKKEDHCKENPDESDVKADNFDGRIFLHPLPAVHATLMERNGQSPVQKLLNSKYKRALSARTDLSIRRVLCGFSTKEPLHLAGCEQLYENSIALFKSALA